MRYLYFISQKSSKPEWLLVYNKDIKNSKCLFGVSLLDKTLTMTSRLKASICLNQKYRCSLRNVEIITTAKERQSAGLLMVVFKEKIITIK